MTKALGLLLVFSGCLLAGWGRALALEREVKKAALWRDLLRQFQVCLETTRAAPGEIIRMLAKETAFTEDERVRAMAAAFRQSGSFAGAVRAALGDQSRPGAVERTLLSLGDVVGVKPLEEQLAALSGAGLLLEQEWERARERSRRYGGLSRRLGLLLGLLAVVVLA